MTYQEAKERFSKERPYLANHDWKIAYYLAEQSLEKQISKKPIGTEEFIRGCCPNCQKYIDDDFRFDDFKFCQFCGQAIDWSDER